MIKITSQLSLLDTAKECKINKRQRQILSLFNKDYGYECLNNRQISDCMGLPINSITPRVNELVKMGILTEHYRRKDVETNRSTIYWRLA